MVSVTQSDSRGLEPRAETRSGALPDVRRQCRVVPRGGPVSPLEVAHRWRVVAVGAADHVRERLAAQVVRLRGVDDLVSGRVGGRRAHGKISGPVAELAAQLTLDGGDRERQERVTPFGIEPVDRVDQTEGGDLGQVLEVHPAAAVSARHVVSDR